MIPTLQAAREKFALCDRSDWGLIEVAGDDRLRFLHNQTTNDFNLLQPGQTCETVFINSTARTIDLATAYVTENTVLLLVSPNLSLQLIQWMDRYIFPMDRVNLTDLSSQYSIYTLIGTESENLLKNLGIEDLNLNEYTHKSIKYLLENMNLRISGETGLAMPGYTVIIAKEAAELFKTKLIESGVTELSVSDWESLRILQGRPSAGAELTEDYNPLEAGLWKTISFDKGCYIGQETIARLNTYKGVKQRLWGVRLRAAVEVGSILTIEQEKVGILTSYTDTESGGFGLAYVRTKAGGAGLTVKVGETTGELVNVPFLQHPD